LVEIEDGWLRGTTLQSRKNTNFFAFMQIPFAEAPVKELRFQDPVKKAKWNGTLIATEYGPMCVQAKSQFNTSENCLHLNVFTKSLSQDALKPVIVFIHGGVSFNFNYQNNLKL
jgi:carboxylesterase type B